MKKLDPVYILIAVFTVMLIALAVGCFVPLFIAMGRAFWDIALNNYMLS
jgi:hypothetical protein